MALKKVTVAECDNPDCNNTHEHSKNEPAQGVWVRGKFSDSAGGGPLRDVYACSFKCLGPAAKAVYEGS
jgi:hypothetical protein